jgi:hypothetical protein
LLLQDLSLSELEDEDEVFPLLEDETFLLLLDLLRELEDFAELLLDSSRSSLRELEELVAIFLLLLESSQSSQMDEDESSSRGATLLSSSPQATRKNAKINAWIKRINLICPLKIRLNIIDHLVYCFSTITQRTE